jgi:hypothetical protein
MILNRKYILFLSLLVVIPQIVFAQELMRLTIYNSSDYTIGVGSCGWPCKEYKKILPYKKVKVDIPKTHQELMIERYFHGVDLGGCSIIKILREMSPDMMLIFIPHHSMVIISKDDFTKINLRDHKSIYDASKGRLKLLD